MHDTGAAKIIISFQTYKKIKQEASQTTLIPYVGSSLRSENNAMQIAGVVKLDRCVFSKKISLDNTKVIVVEDLEEEECLQSRDWMNRIPGFQDTLSLTMSTKFGKN